MPPPQRARMAAALPGVRCASGGPPAWRVRGKPAPAVRERPLAGAAELSPEVSGLEVLRLEVLRPVVWPRLWKLASALVSGSGPRSAARGSQAWVPAFAMAPRRPRPARRSTLQAWHQAPWWEWRASAALRPGRAPGSAAVSVPGPAPRWERPGGRAARPRAAAPRSAPATRKGETALLPQQTARGSTSTVLDAHTGLLCP